MPTFAAASLPSLAPAAAELVAHYQSHGYVVAPGLFAPATARQMREHFMARRAEGVKPGDMGGDSRRPEDPLNRYPRMINMHQWDEPTAGWAAEPALLALAGACIGQRAVLNQTMLYFKPPGARGQALHQDQQYITKDPLIGAWCALDRCDAANGQMVVVPDSPRLGILPVRKDDSSQSFSGGQAVLPPGLQEHGVDMEPGDVLFFSGSTIHGSYPNRTSDRFRRGFICHYVGEHAVDFLPQPGHHMSHLAP